MPLSEADIAEIERISRKKSVRRVSHSIVNYLDKDTLSMLVSSFLVLKAHGHPDSDLIKYLATKSKTLQLGLKVGSSALPSIFSDSELRSLMLKTRQQLNKQKQKDLKTSERNPPKRRRIIMLESATRV
jgi:hypothetical protein